MLGLWLSAAAWIALFGPSLLRCGLHWRDSAAPERCCCVLLAACLAVAVVGRRGARVLPDGSPGLCCEIMSGTSSGSSSQDYGLPATGEKTAWAGLMQPCTGRLQLVKSSGRRRLLTPQVAAVEVWLHCGLHFQPVGLAGAGCTPPLHGKMTEVDRPKRHNQHFPLRRTRPGEKPTISATVVRGEGVPGLEGRWMIELTKAANPDHPLRFCAATKEDAEAWVRQLRMRLAPLTLVWSRCVGMVIGGCNNDAGIGAGRDERVTSGPEALSAVAGSAANAMIAKDVLSGVMGIIVSVLHPGAYNVAVGAAPVVGMALHALGFAIAIIKASREVSAAVTVLLRDLDYLEGNLRLLLNNLPG